MCASCGIVVIVVGVGRGLFIVWELTDSCSICRASVRVRVRDVVFFCNWCW